MAPEKTPVDTRCTALVYDTKMKKRRPCRNKMKIGTLCSTHAKMDGIKSDSKTDVSKNDLSSSQSVLVDDEITASLQNLTLDNEEGVLVESQPSPQDWRLQRVTTGDSFLSFDSLDTERNRFVSYMPPKLSNLVYKDVLQSLSAKPTRDRPGHVYIFRSTPTWRTLEHQEMIIKIGRADNVEERKRSLENWCKHYTFELIYPFEDTESERKIRLSKKAEKLSHKSLDNRLYQATASGKCLCQIAHKELFKITESELKSAIKIVQHWVDAMDKYDEIWPGLFKGRHSIM